MDSRVKPSKKRIIFFSIAVAISLFLPYIFIKDAVITTFRPESNGSYLYGYGSGRYAKGALNLMIVALIIYLAIIVYLVVKKEFIVFIPIHATFVLACFFFMIFIVYAIRETRSLASYTIDVSNYGYYDELVIEEMKQIEPLLPNKEDIIRYEYLLAKISDIWGSSYNFTIYIEINYEENIENEIIGNEEYRLVDDIEDESFNDYNVYSRHLEYSGNKRQLISYFYVLISKDKSKIYYGLSHSADRMTKRYENNLYIFGFISGDRDNPYHKYVEDKGGD